MDKETLKRTVDQMYESVQAVAEKRPEQLYEKDDLERVLTAAKTLYGEENDVIRNMDSGHSLFRIKSVDYAQKLAILKAQIDHEYGEKATKEEQRLLEEEMGKRRDEAMRKRRVGF